MVFWSRTTRLPRLGIITNRHYHHSPDTNQQHIGLTRIRVLERTPRAQPYGFVRFFAAPVLANNPKPEPKEDIGYRLNDKIIAEFVRLVEEDRHEVVSRREALDRARKLKLDLVEVDRTAKPPVCKILDYHKEKYKRQVSLKEKAKSKTEGALRKGPPKEIRFTDKTEQRDLQTKAAMAKRLMEKGHRVKCMAVGKEDQDLEGMLQRLSALIEDVALIESGPMVEKKQAYVIVRHVKFGLLKKGSGKKTSTASTKLPGTPSSMPIQGSQEIEEDLDEPDAQSESEDDIDPEQMETPSLPHSMPVGYTNSRVPSFAQVNRGRDATNTVPQGPAQIGDNRYGGRGTVPQGPAQIGDNRYGGRGTVPQGPVQIGDNRYGGQGTVPQGPAQVGDNRYGRRGATNTVPQGPAQVGDNRYGGRGPKNTVPQGPAQVGNNRYGGRDEVRGRFHPINSTQGLADVTRLSESNPTPAQREVRSMSHPSQSEFSPVHARQVNRGPGATNTPYPGSRMQGDVPSVGIFTRPPTDNATGPPKRSSYGIFSTSKNHSPSRQSVPTEVSGNPQNVDARPEVDDQREETRKWGRFGR